MTNSSHWTKHLRTWRSDVKQPLEWHKQNLANMTVFMTSQQRTLDRQKEDLARTQARIDFLTDQIKHAERQGMTAFDSDRLLKKRVKK